MLLVVADAEPRGGLRLPWARCAARLAEKHGPHRPEAAFNFLWVTDFPLFEYDEEEGRYVAKHHPFTSPQRRRTWTSWRPTPAHVRAKAYDMVLNGCEVGGGSIRINDPDAAGADVQAPWALPRRRPRSSFGFLIDAFTLRRSRPTAAWPSAWTGW